MTAIECPQADGSSERRTSFPEEPPLCIDVAKRYTATMVTSKGEMVIALDPLAAPKTVNSFVYLARYHYYDGLTFHRVIPGFVLQGGCPLGNGTGGPGYHFDDELPQAGRYQVGSLAMANAGPNTNGSQFFITVAATPHLDNKHSVFGEVTEGYEVVKKISLAPRNAQDRPNKEIRIHSVKIERA